LYDDIAVLNKKNIKLDIVIIHNDVLTSNKKLDILTDNNLIKILASNKINKNTNFDGILKLPITLSDINSKVESLAAKKIYNKNSSINIKNYTLDKNEKKLIKNNHFIILTEKEIQLLELLLSYKKPVSKNIILSTVWNYADDADTHTVETHIYRLRKKINNKFFDEKFILNNKDGYYVWKKEIKLPKIFFLQNIESVLLNQKKVEEVLKEKKVNLI